MGQVVGIAIVWFIIEMLVWYLIAQFISGWWVFFWFIIAAIIGINLIRGGMKTLNPMAQQMKAGGMMGGLGARPPETLMMKSVATALAGLLLLIPGVISDILAVLVVLPPVQKKIKDKVQKYVMNNQEKMMAMMAERMGGQMGGQNPFGDMSGQNPFGGAGGMHGQNPFGDMFKTNTTVDGSAKTVEKDVKKIAKSANDE